MSEPKARARAIMPVLDDVLHWTVRDDRIGFRSDAWALVTPDGHVLIDPLPLDDSLLGRLSPVMAICLTGGFHQRAAWRLREHFRAPVWAPEAASGLDGEPDERYEADDILPGGLRALHTPGPAHLHFSFLHERDDNRAALFLGDLLIRPDEDAPLAFVPDRLQENPRRTRETVRMLAEEIRPDILFPAHGPAILERGTAALLDALARDS
ncbi:MAG: hypothetical protein Kow0062_02310 [Acidobacteriota bacterium]